MGNTNYKVTVKKERKATNSSTSVTYAFASLPLWCKVCGTQKQTEKTAGKTQGGSRLRTRWKNYQQGELTLHLKILKKLLQRSEHLLQERDSKVFTKRCIITFKATVFIIAKN